MTKREKLLDKFLEDPEQLAYSDIEKCFKGWGYSIIWWKWSHLKIKHLKSWKTQTVAIHNKECKKVYKKKLNEFYILTQWIWQKK